MPENIKLELDLIPYPTIIISSIGRIMTYNHEANRICNGKEKISDILPEFNLDKLNIQDTFQTCIDNYHYEITVKKMTERFLMFFHNITDFKNAEKKIQQHKTFLRKVIDTDPNLIFIKNSKGEFTLANQTVANIYGTTSELIIGKTDAYFNGDENEVECFNHDDMFVINNHAELDIREEKVTTKDGKTIWLETKKLPIQNKDGEWCVLGISADITHRKTLQEQLLHSQKLDAIGKLAGGIAHDFNNLLTGILGYTSVLSLEDNLTTSAKHSINSIVLASERASNLTQQLLAFARKGKHQNIDIDLHQLIEESLNLISRTFEKNIFIENELTANNYCIKGDPTQIQQVIINLAINSKEALINGGNIKISTINENEKLILKIKDNGCGISQENLDKIFDPFFTTKESGTGMGLAMVYGIIDNHDGKISVSSLEGIGTEFSLELNFIENIQTLPVLEKEVIKNSTKNTVLLVDDHSMIRDVTSQMLGRLGYETIVAKDGFEAIEIYRQNHQQIDLIILDMIMPKLNSREIFNQLRIINPQVKVVLSTGYINNLSVQSILNEGMVGFVQKPYHIESLSTVVAKALN